MGSQIIYVAGSTQLWVMNADGSDAHLVFGVPGELFMAPIWTADGSAIIFSQGDYEANLRRVNIDGAGVIDLTTAVGGGENRPSLSRDGSTIALYRWSDTADWGIYTTPAEGGAPLTFLVEANRTRFSH